MDVATPVTPCADLAARIPSGDTDHVSPRDLAQRHSLLVAVHRISRGRTGTGAEKGSQRNVNGAPSERGRSSRPLRRLPDGKEAQMTYVVNESCIKCKLMDCVEVCPVDCFYEGENMLVIHPDECIDCGVCEPECPVDAIKPDTEPGLEKWLSINTEIRQAMAQYYAQEGTSGRCQRVGGGARQGTIFLTKSWRRHLIKAGDALRQQLAYLKRSSPLPGCTVSRCRAAYAVRMSPCHRHTCKRGAMTTRSGVNGAAEVFDRFC